eukprot:COSAG06_NODE_63559_length_262_cov_0.619632_2_plen_32_part_01
MNGGRGEDNCLKWSQVALRSESTMSSGSVDLI